jgi:hypothetical protein
MAEPQMSDDLLRPTLQGFEAPGAGGGPSPWQLGSQFYVAFLGGPLAATIIAWLNAGRLDLARPRRLSILLGGAGATLAAAFAAGRFGAAADHEAMRFIRVGWRALALLLCGGFYLMQKSTDRLYQMNARPEAAYASLWIPGTVIVVGSALAQFLLTMVAARYWAPGP